MIVRPNSLQEILLKAEKFGFGARDQNTLVYTYDLICAQYVRENPLPSIHKFEDTCAWIDGKYETAYKATIKKLYEMVDGEQKK